MVDLLTSMYPDDTSSTQCQPTAAAFRRLSAVLVSAAVAADRAGDNTPAQSDRMKKLAHVSAVADKRTSSLVVTAGTNVMNDIAMMIDDLDSRNDHKMSVHIIPLVNADPVDVQSILQDIYPAPTSGGGSS